MSAPTEDPTPPKKRPKNLGVVTYSTPDRPMWESVRRWRGSDLPSGTVSILPQTPTVRTPYRPMSSPANYASRIHLSDNLAARGLISPEVNQQAFQDATDRARFLSAADRQEGAVTEAIRDYNQQAYDEAGRPLSLADNMERQAQRATSRLTPEEVDRYSADSIEAQNIIDDRLFTQPETRPAYLGPTGRPWLGAHAKALADAKIAKNNDAPVGQDLEVTGAGASTYSRLSWLAANNRGLFQSVSQAVSQGTMDPIDVAKVTNMSLAYQAAVEIANTPDQMRRDQLLAAQGNDAQRALVVAILVDKARQDRVEPDPATQDLKVKATKWLADLAMDYALPFLAETSNFLVRGAMTVSNVGGNDVVGYDTQDNLMSAQWNPAMWRDAWNQTRPGYYRPQDVQHLEEKYGKAKVDLLMEAIQLRNLGEGDVVGTLYDKYVDNPEALNILDGLFFSRTPSTEMQDLVQETAFLDSGNYGNWQLRGLASAFAGQDAAENIWSIPAYSWMRDGFNVVSWVALDPYLMGGKVFRTMKYARLGLHHLAPGKVDKVFQKASVRTYWDDLGRRLEETRKLGSGVERRAALRRIARQEKQWFTPDVIQSLYKAEVKNADDALEWFREMDNVVRVMNGQPARRATQKYVPHAGMGRVTVKRKQISNALRMLDPTMRVAERWGKDFDTVAAEADEMTGASTLAGRSWSELDDKETVEALVRISNNPAAAEHLGKWMTDLTGERTIAGRFWDAVRIGKMDKARQYGWARRRTADRYMQAISRTFATVPDMRAGIHIGDARDTQKVYQQARVAGFPRWFAVELSELFAAADVGQRRLLLSGLARTQGYVIGADLVADGGVEKLVKLVTGYRMGESYAASMIPGAERKLRQIVAEVRAESDATLRVATDEEAADDIALLNEIHGQNTVNDAVDFEAARALREEYAAEVRRLQKELDDIDAGLQANAGKADWELGQGFEDEVRAALRQQADGTEAANRGSWEESLDGFVIPPPREYATSGMRWQKKAGGSSTARVRNQQTGEMVTYRVSQTGGGWRLEVERSVDASGGMKQTEVTEIGVYDNKRMAQRQAQIEAGRVTEVRTPASGIDATMLERGFLPVRWAEDLRDGTLRATDDGDRVWQESQARLYENPSAGTDEMFNVDWQAVVETATKVPGVKGRWVPIPWMRDLRERVRREWEGLTDENTTQVENQLDEALRNLDGQDEFLAELRAAGILDMEELRAALPPRTGRSEDEILELARTRWDTWVRSQIPESPSEGPSGQGAVFVGQLADRVAFPALNQLEPLMARNTYMGVLLGRNVGAQTLTDLWVFATLAGPRFPIRNAFEDWMFWGLTAGAFIGPGSLRKGRRAAQGMRQARQIENKRVVAAEKALAEARDELENARGTRAVNEVRTLEQRVEEAEKRLADMRGKASNTKVRTEKLGIIKTAMRRFGTAVMRFDNTVDPMDSRLRSLVHPYLSDDEVARANLAYRDGDREELARLIGTATAREKLLYIPSGRGVSEKLKNWVRARNGDRAVLDESDRKMLEEIEQFAMGRYGFEQLDEASEMSRNMMDGNLPSWQDSPDFVFAGDTPLQRMFINGEYKTIETPARPNKKSVDSTWQTLVMALHGDGPKSQAAMYYLPDWMRSDMGEREEIVAEVARRMILADEEVGYIQRFSLVNAAGDIDEEAVKELARRTLLTLEGLFTTRQGTFNEALWQRLRIVEKGSDGGDIVKFKLWQDAPTGNLKLDGTEEIGRTYNVNKSDFINGDIELPRTYLTFDGIPVVSVAENSRAWGWWQNISNPAWDAMGRSLARLTREPMYMANYLDARASLRPFESEWRRLYGDDWWRVADEVANEQAYNVTLSYVDNPAVRSQLAWQVRNVARFWRATEDFYRRTYRMVKNNPMGVYKAAWAFNHMNDMGWIQADENGDRYFIYPGTQPMFDAMNVFMNFAGFRADFGLGSADLPIAMTGRVTGLTPSADPEASLPTLSGWFSTIPVRMLLRAAPSLDRFLEPYTNVRTADAANVAEATLFGDITAESMDPARDWMPTHLKRLMSVFEMAYTSNKDMQSMVSGAAADAVRMAITANVRAGRIKPDEEITNENRDEIFRMIDATATDMMVLKLLSGLLLPASPNFKADDVSEIAQEFGVYSLKQEYYELRERLGDQAAQMLWFERHPDEAPYTVSSATGSEYDGFWKATAATEEWIRQNRSLVDQYPLGASVVAPPQDTSIFNAATYTFLQRQGLVNKGTVGEFLYKSVSSRTWLEYQSAMAEYDAGIEYAYQTIRDPEVLKATLKELDERLANRRQALYRQDPGLEERIMANPQGMSPQATANEMAQAVNAALPNAQGAQLKRLTDMQSVLNMYGDAKTRMDSISDKQRLTREFDDYKETMRDRWKNFVLDWYGKYREDDGFVSVLRTTSDALGFQIGELR